MAGEVREKCAVSAVVLSENEGSRAALLNFEMLEVMQHRGPEASGMVSFTPDGETESHHGRGLVRNVYGEDDILRLIGRSIIGHDRYSTDGRKDKHFQPFNYDSINYAFGHNGNFPVTDRMATYLDHHAINHRPMNDSGMAAATTSQGIRDGRDLATAIELSYPYLTGAFSCVAMHKDTVVAFRDSKGIKPLELGQISGGFVVASETCALDRIDAEHLGSVNPGEIVTITGDGISRKQIEEADPKLDIFEFVYFARHDSYFYGKRVNEVRKEFGRELAKMHPPMTDDVNNIRVMPVPDTSIPAAEGYAHFLGLQHEQGIIKNRYIGKTFLLPTQEEREIHLRRKHTVLRESVEGRDLIIIDDSIVRLNTLPRLVEQARSYNAKSITILISSAPVRFPDFYGIDTPHQSDLAAANMTIEQMREKMDVDYLGFLSISAMVKATGVPEDQYNLSAFNGKYPISIGKRMSEIKSPVSEEYMD